MAQAIKLAWWHLQARYYKAKIWRRFRDRVMILTGKVITNRGSRDFVMLFSGKCRHFLLQIGKFSIL